VILLDREGRLECAKWRDHQPVVRTKWRKVSNGECGEENVAAERYWSSNCIQHSAHIEPGREGLFNLIKSMPPMFKYESREIVAEEDFVIVHGRFSGIGQPVNWIAADIVRVKDDVLAEHWDVIEDEVTQERSKSGHPMLGDTFPK
jgi:predicted SnoaL-like aldol condensation-catalyzing enzyme